MNMMRHLVLIALAASLAFGLVGSPLLIAAPSESNTCPPGTSPELRFWEITVRGTADGSGWSWCINGPTYSVCDSNVAGPLAGSGPAAIVEAIVASINASGCAGIIAGAVQDSSFAIGSSCVQGFEFCIGPAGSTPTCCISELDPNSCSVDATFEQLDFYECFMCGDVNNSGNLSISDVIYLIAFVFSGGPPPPYCVGNANGDCVLSISDAVYIVSFIFAGGPSPGNCWW